MCALFIWNDLCKHNWQAEKTNRMTGQERNLKQQEMKCWICATPGGEWATFIWHSVVGGPKTLLQELEGVWEGPTFHDGTPCRPSRPRCPPQNCWRLREGKTWKWQLRLWTAWTPAPYCPVEKERERRRRRRDHWITSSQARLCV